MQIKELRVKIDELVFEVEKLPDYKLDENANANEFNKFNEEKRAIALVRTKLQEAKMWAGKILEAQNKSLPAEYADHCEERKKDEEDTTVYEDKEVATGEPDPEKQDLLC